MNIQEIQSYLPQQYPFLFIDKVIDLESKKSIVGIKNITINEPFFQGHVPGNPIVPGSIILEAMSQTSSLLFLTDPEYSGRFASFASIEQVSFIKDVIPGDQLRLEMEVKKVQDTSITMQGRALVEGKMVCEGLLSFSLAAKPTKPQIHPTASVHSSAIIGKDVSIGPYTQIGENVVIGDRTVIESNITIEKWTKIGEDCHIHFGTMIGSEAQDMGYKGEKSWVVIGDRNVIREYVTINRATGANNVTEIGNDNLLLTHVHVAHNCKIGNHVTIVNTTNLAGYVSIDDYTTIGGMCGIHQFTRIGKFCMIGGYTRLVQDLPHFMLSEGNPALVRGLNVIGLRRNGFSKEAIQEVKECHKLFYRSHKNSSQALSEIQNHTFKTKEAKEFIDFISTDSKRGILKATAQKND